MTLFTAHWHLGNVITVQHGSADTVVRAMDAFNGKCRFSGSASSETPWPIFKKIGTVDYVVDPTPHARIGVNRFKGGASAHAWNCHPQASIFFSFFFDLIPLDRSSSLTAQMTRSGGHYALFMVSLIRKIFSLFLPKNVKNCIAPYGNFEQL